MAPRALGVSLTPSMVQLASELTRRFTSAMVRSFLFALPLLYLMESVSNLVKHRQMWPAPWASDSPSA
jgi:hypothetical protein